MNASVPLSALVGAVAAAPSRSGAAVLLDTLVELGVDTVFGYPGGAVLPLYDALHAEPRIRHILVRHEQAAVHAAEGYARSTGKVGVVIVTSGPGMSNTTTGRAVGLHPGAVHQRPGGHARDRHRRLPGMRRARHFASGDQVERAGAARA
jgi:hypothetical protein